MNSTKASITHKLLKANNLQALLSSRTVCTLLQRRPDAFLKRMKELHSFTVLRHSHKLSHPVTQNNGAAHRQGTQSQCL